MSDDRPMEQVLELIRTWMDRTSALQARVDVLEVVSAVLARDASQQQRDAVRSALLTLQRSGAERSWETGTMLEEEVARFLKVLR
ncbi:hypothetical protein [Stenotrophomonas maltophilia]|uniref:hypothetical protein n=1 Tax=Stenotrophomonas maltophilia TaxID=40324 RepID=UPI0005A8CF0F|nr:hypothetical protein [Stenotrophomonas maltophilia]